MWHRHLAMALLCLAVTGLVTGCVTLDYHVTFRDSNRVTVDMTALVNREAVGWTGSAPLEKLVNQGRAEGYEVRRIDDTRGSGLMATRDFDLRYSDPIVQFTDAQNHTFRVEPSLFTSKVTFRTGVDLSSDTEALSGTGLPWGGSVAESMRLQFRMSLPRAPISSNATWVEDGGRTLIWDLQPGATNPIEVEFMLLRWKVIGTAIGGFAVLALALLFSRWAFPTSKRLTAQGAASPGSSESQT